MTTKTKWRLGLALSLMVAGAIVPACVVRAQGVGQKVGQALDNAGKTVKQGVENAFSRTKAAVHAQDTLARVYSRIHWDKTLTGSVLDMDFKDDGTITLRGGVPDVAAKERAVLLAKDTVGVNRVVDELAVMPAPQTTPSTVSPKAAVRP